MRNDDYRATQIFLTIIHLQHRRNEDNALLDRILTADESRMHSFEHQLTWQNAEWRDQMSPRKIARCGQGALRVTHVRFFSREGLVLDHPVPDGTTVSGWYYCSLLQDKVRPVRRCRQLELLQNGVTSLQDNTTPHHHHDVQSLVQCCGREVLAHPPCSPDLAPCDYWLFAFVTELLLGKRFESEKYINSAVSVS